MPKQRDQKLKERDRKLFRRIRKHGKMILPLNNRKLRGSVRKSDTKGKWRTSFSGKNRKRFGSKTHDNERDAENYLVRLNLVHRLDIRNIIYEYENEYYCSLTKGQFMKFSPQDYDLVEKYIWFAHYDKSVDDYYTCTKVSGNKTRSFLQLLHNPDSKKGESGDHIDHTRKWDNTRENTRVANATTQNVNKGIQSNNTSGVRGVNWSNKGSWVASWIESDKDGNIKPRKKSFSVEKYKNHPKNAYQLAVEYRANATRDNDIYNAINGRVVDDGLA